MKKLPKFILLIGLTFMILAGCASEESAPTAIQIDKGTIHYHLDRFMATIGDGNDSLFYVYTPPGYTAANDYPVLYLLNGFGGNESYFVALFNAADAADWLLARGEIDPMIIVFPSGHTAMGGSFYNNSPHPRVGQSEQHILNIMAEVDANYSTIVTPAGRAIGGHSMGGFGAMSIALNNPGTFGSVSVYAAPMYFEVVKALLSAVLIETGYDSVLTATAGAGDAAAYQSMIRPTSARTVTSMMFAMSAVFSYTIAPGPTTMTAYGVDIPIKVDGTIDESGTFARWLNFDLLTRITRPGAGNQLASLNGVNIYLDAGEDDDLYCQQGHSAFAQALAGAGVPADVNTTFESFETPEGQTIPADHSTQTYERIKKLLVWCSGQF